MLEPVVRVLYRAPEVFREHPPQLRHPHKVALLRLAYPTNRTPADVDIELTRWSAATPALASLATSMSTSLEPNFYTYQPTVVSAPGLEWHVNFADPRLFVAYGSGLFAQDEIQVAEHPLLGSICEALFSSKLPASTVEGAHPTPILIRNVERRLAFDTLPNPSAGRPKGIYGNAFSRTPFEFIREATTVVEGESFSNFIAMSAPFGGTGAYSTSSIAYILSTAHTAFSAAVQETRGSRGDQARTVIHSGFWGCGAFGGNRTMMIAAQSLAARAAGVDGVVFHCGDVDGVETARRAIEVADTIARRSGETAGFDALVSGLAMHGFRWGTSDGN